MSHDMFTASEVEDKNYLSWKEYEVKKWADKARGCFCHSGLDLRACKITSDLCCYAKCPFIYWGGAR